MSKIEIVERLGAIDEEAMYHAPATTKATIDDAALTIQSLVKALDGAERFISNGIELGFIRMPDRDDPALETLPNIRSVLSKLRGSK